jgi:hypothetical protein
MKTIALKQKDQFGEGFEIVSNENNEVVFRKMLAYHPSKKYEEKLTTVTLKGFTEEQLKELVDKKLEIYTRIAELKKLQEQSNQSGFMSGFLIAFKRFLME